MPGSGQYAQYAPHQEDNGFYTMPDQYQGGLYIPQGTTSSLAQNIAPSGHLIEAANSPPYTYDSMVDRFNDQLSGFNEQAGSSDLTPEEQ